MTEVTQILQQIEDGDHIAIDRLLPLIYQELRQLAALQLNSEKPDQTLNATALVHEAYLRLVGEQHFENRRYFFASAAEAMRRILIERARRRITKKHGGSRQRIAFDEALKIPEEHPEELLALDEALSELEKHDSRTANLIKLRFFAGFSHQEAAMQLGISRRVADRLWTMGRTWLYTRLQNS